MLFLISHYTSRQINRDVSRFRIVMLTAQFSVVWFVTWYVWYVVCCLCHADILHIISYASDCTIFLSSRWDAPRASRFHHSKVHDLGIRTDVFDVWSVFHASQRLYMLFLIRLITPYYIIAYLLIYYWVWQISVLFASLGGCWVCNQSSLHVYQ